MDSSASPTPTPRASDQEREHTADVLRTAAAEGRLDPEELDERMGQAFSARTRAELATLTADLPAVAPPAPKGPTLWEDHKVRGAVIGFVTAGGITTLIWLATGADTYFWPLWVLLGTGISVIATVAGHFNPDHEDERRERERGRRRGRGR